MRFFLHSFREMDAPLVQVTLGVNYYLPDPAKTCMAVLGSVGTLGDWNPACAVRGQCTGGEKWQVTVDVPRASLVEWKWVVLDTASNSVQRWEVRKPRQLFLQVSGLSVSTDWEGRSSEPYETADWELPRGFSETYETADWEGSSSEPYETAVQKQTEDGTMVSVGTQTEAEHSLEEGLTHVLVKGVTEPFLPTLSVTEPPSETSSPFGSGDLARDELDPGHRADSPASSDDVSITPFFNLDGTREPSVQHDGFSSIGASRSLLTPPLLQTPSGRTSCMSSVSRVLYDDEFDYGCLSKSSPLARTRTLLFLILMFVGIPSALILGGVMGYFISKAKS